MRHSAGGEEAGSELGCGQVWQLLGHCRRYKKWGASLMAQWLRIHLAMKGTPVWSLIWEDPTSVGQLDPCATTIEPALQSPGTTTSGSTCGNYWGLPVCELVLRNEGSPLSEKPARCNWRKASHSSEDQAQSKIKVNQLILKKDRCGSQNTRTQLWWHLPNIPFQCFF